MYDRERFVRALVEAYLLAESPSKEADELTLMLIRVCGGSEEEMVKKVDAVYEENLRKGQG